MPLPFRSKAVLSASLMTVVVTLALPAFAQADRCMRFLGFCLPPHQDQASSSAGDQSDRTAFTVSASLPTGDSGETIDPIDPSLVDYTGITGFDADGVPLVLTVKVPATYLGRPLDFPELFEFEKVFQKAVDKAIANGATPVPDPTLGIRVGPSQTPVANTAAVDAIPQTSVEVVTEITTAPNPQKPTTGPSDVQTPTTEVPPDSAPAPTSPEVLVE